jgi:ribosomal protein S18 acetylase RimI-like enzyme
MASEPSFVIRPMTRSELETVRGWAEDEGWNPGLHDCDTYYATDPGAYLSGHVNGEMMAAISAVRYGEGFGFLGLYIVRPSFRGQGYGIRMWNAGLAHLGTRVAGLDGVVERQDDYRRSGFALAFRNMRYCGETAPATATPAGLVPLQSISIDALVRYDAQMFPAERRTFLEGWVNQAGSHGLALMRAGAMAGYGVIRPAASGFRIGPLFADDPETAEALFAALTGSVPPGQPLYLDLPEPNERALTLAERHGMSLVFETARMYKGPAPELPLERIYGITTFELG